MSPHARGKFPDFSFGPRVALIGACALARCGHAISGGHPPDRAGPSVDGDSGAGIGGAAGADPRTAFREVPPSWIRTEGTAFVDAIGRSRRFSGVVLSNGAWGRWQWPVSDGLAAQGKDPLVRPTVFPDWTLDDADYAALDALPINVVRYDFNHELFAADNPLRAANLDRLAGNVSRLGRFGVYSVVDLDMPVGLDVQSDAYERSKPPNRREKSFFEDDAFYAATVDLWQAVARRLSALPEVLAFELVNEPRVPCAAEGGVERYRARLQGLVDAIRAVDDRHVILVPEWNSREADDANQTVQWGQGMVALQGHDLAYVLHLYTPYEFTLGGTTSSFDAAAIRADLRTRVDWRDRVGHAPLFATEHGVIRGQPVDERVAWLRTVQRAFLDNGVSATWFTYKAEVSAYIDPKTILGLRGQFVERAAQVVTTPGGWKWTSSSVENAARSNGFEPFFERYFLALSAGESSELDSAPLLEQLKRFQTGF